VGYGRIWSFRSIETGSEIPEALFDSLFQSISVIRFWFLDFGFWGVPDVVSSATSILGTTGPLWVKPKSSRWVPTAILNDHMVWFINKLDDTFVWLLHISHRATHSSLSRRLIIGKLGKPSRWPTQILLAAGTADGGWINCQGVKSSLKWWFRDFQHQKLHQTEMPLRSLEIDEFWCCRTFVLL